MAQRTGWRSSLMELTSQPKLVQGKRWGEEKYSCQLQFFERSPGCEPSYLNDSKTSGLGTDDDLGAVARDVDAGRPELGDFHRWRHHVGFGVPVAQVAKVLVVARRKKIARACCWQRLKRNEKVLSRIVCPIKSSSPTSYRAHLSKQKLSMLAEVKISLIF